MWLGIVVGLAVACCLLILAGVVGMLIASKKEQKYARESGWQKFPNGWFKVWPNIGRVEATNIGATAACRIMPVRGELIDVEGFSSKLYVMQFSDWLMDASGLQAGQALTRDIVVSRQAQYSPADRVGRH